MRYYIGVDWAEEAHAARVEDEQGQRVSAGRVPHSPVGFSEWGRQLDEWRAQGIVLWAAIERPEGVASAPGRPVSESDRLCHGDGPTDGAPAPPEGGNVGLYEAGWPCQVGTRSLPLELRSAPFPARR